MKKLLLAIALVAVAQVFGQNTYEKCGFDYVHQKMMQQDDQYRKKTELFNISDLSNLLNKAAAAPPYRIPVVVHVMYKGEAVGTGSNISDDDIKSGIRYLNERFRKVAGGVGDGSGVDTQIEYALAVRDPSGNCTNGIVRYDMSGESAYMSCGVDAGGGCGVTDNYLMSLSRWNSNNYYNIYLVYEINNNECGSGIQGFAYFASAHGGSIDGAIMLSCTFGGSSGTTLTHELGHSLNLYHTFEGDGGGGFCPSGNGCGSGVGDCCADTPPHARSSSDCVVYSNSCDGGSSSNLFIHNYLDYSSDGCQSEFTTNQSTRMQTALTGTRASFLESNGNMSLVPPSAPTADFTASAAILCTGSSIKFLDNSTCIPNTYQNDPWTNITFSWTFDNGVDAPINSTDQNPTITFSNSGTYDVTLQVTNASGTNSITKNNFIIVSAAPGAACAISSTNGNETTNYAVGIQKTALGSINYSSGTTYSEGVIYTDLTCTYSTTLQPSTLYPLTVIAGRSGWTEDVKAYIDYDNSGTFSAGEIIYNETNLAGTERVANFTTPASPTMNTSLVMRVLSNPNGWGVSPCTTPDFGQVEDYTVYFTNNSGLEVKLFTFDVVKDKNDADLNWVAKTDNDFSKFEIERSNDGKYFEKIGEVKAGKNTNGEMSYSFKDISTLNGKNYYRLKMINKNQGVRYSNIEWVEFDGKLSVFPNPFSDILTLSGITEEAKVTIIDISGKLISTQKVNKNLSSINTSELPEGMYFITIQTENNTFVDRIIKSNK